MIRKVLFIMGIVYYVDNVECMESYVVGGAPAKMQYYGHSAFVILNNYACGSSIINQNILLSAAHCFEDTNRQTKIMIRAGHSNRMKGTLRYASKVAVHGNYNEDTITNDIALVYVNKPFTLGPSIQKVILLKNPPKEKVGTVAGWGLIDERKEIDTDWLQYTEQKLWSRNECAKILKWIPLGSICGGAKYSNHFAAAGDSGSALVTKNYVQIGIVSFKRPEISRALVVYTDIAYFYDWIIKTSKMLYCS